MMSVWDEFERRGEVHFESEAQTRTVLPTDGKARKGIPLATGLLDYFPAALAAVAEVSRIGNEKHNPGEPLHWARGKSTDHADCIPRHLMERGDVDHDTHILHSAEMAWRALALLQEELEQRNGAPLPRGARDIPQDGPEWTQEHEDSDADRF